MSFPVRLTVVLVPVLAIWGIIWAVSYAYRPSVVLTLQAEDRYQTISAWEAALTIAVIPMEETDYFTDADLPPAYLDVIAERSGIDRVRMPVFSGAERRDNLIGEYLSGAFPYDEFKPQIYIPENDNADPNLIDPDGFDFTVLDHLMETYVLPLRARNPGREIAVNLCYVHFKDTPFLHLDPAEYAEFMLAAFRHLDDRFGATPEYIEVILEPDNKTSSVFSPKHVGDIVVATAAKLGADGYAPKFIIGSVVDARNAVDYLAGVAAVPGALDHVAELDYHRYYGGTNAVVSEIAEKAAALGVDTSMLEWWDKRADAAMLLRDLTLGNVSAWQNGYTRDYVQMNRQGGARLNPNQAATAAIFRNAPRGSVRVGLTGGPEAGAAAFERPDEGAHVIFYHADGAARLTAVDQDDAGPVAARFFPERGRLAQLADIFGFGRSDGIELDVTAQGDRLDLDVPGRGIVVLVRGGPYL